MIFPTFLALGCFVIMGKQTTAAPDLVTGAIVEQIGQKTVLVEGILKLVIQFQAPPSLYKQLVHYKEILGELGRAVSNLTYFKPNDEREFIGTELGSMISLDIERFKEKLDVLMSLDWIKPNSNGSNENLNSSTINKRTKRGAFDLGGIFLSSLFGLATEGNLKLIDNKIDVVTNAVKASNVAMIQLNVDKKHILIQIELMKKKLYKFGHTVEVFEHLQWLHDRYILFNFQLIKIREFFDFLFELDYEINNLITGAQGNSLHILPKNLFPFELFEKMNSATEEKLNMKSVAPLTRKTFSYYLNAARIFPRHEHLTMTMIIPYASEKVYDTYKFHSFPTYHKNIQQYRIMLNFRLPYMLLSSDLKSITNLDENDFRLCNHVFVPSSTYLCYLSHTLYVFPLSKTDELAPQRCQETIIRMNSSEECKFSPYTLNDTVIKRIKERLYLSSTRPVHAVVNCPSGNTQPLLKELTILSSGCSYSSGSMSLLNYREVRGNLLVPLSTKEISVLSALDFSEKFPKEIANFTPIIAFTDHDALIQEKIKESDHLLVKAKEMSTHGSFITYVSSGVSVTIILILGIVFSCIYYNHEPRYVELPEPNRYHRRIRYATTVETPDEAVEDPSRIPYVRPYGGPTAPQAETTMDETAYTPVRPGTPIPVCRTFLPLHEEDYVPMDRKKNDSPTPSR